MQCSPGTSGSLESCAQRRAAQLREATCGLFCPERDGRRAPPGAAGPRVSVVCPTSEERLLFHAQLYCCFAASQLDGGLELVVVDTGLSGPSPMLRRLAEQDDRVVYRHFAVPSHGWPVGLKRNIALHLSLAPVVAHFDDDDLYAPEYLARMLDAMGDADAVTLSSWFVFDTLTGRFAQVDPLAELFYDRGWVYGYGFSYLYRREAALQCPFPDGSFFAEDSAFMHGLQLRGGGRGVALTRDDVGLALHMQHGGNLSNSHAHVEVAASEMAAAPVSRAPGFEWYVTSFRPRPAFDSPHLTLGAARFAAGAASPRDPARLCALLASIGVVARCRAGRPGAAGWCEDAASALVSFSVRLGPGRWVEEPGRVLRAVARFSAEALLPADVPRAQDPARLALLHVARLLLRRTRGRRPPRGSVSLRLCACPSVSVMPLFGLFLRHFPGLTVHVDLAAPAPPEPASGGPCGRGGGYERVT